MQKMTWEEMKAAYPDEWLLVVNFTTDEFGEVATGTVVRHSRDMDDIGTWPQEDKPTAFRYTGESTFAGLRSHAEHHNSI